MNGPMRWGGGFPMGCGEGEHQIGIPLIPAPVAFFAMVFGLMIGVMIGRKAAIMHGVEPGMSCGTGEWDHWAMRKKMMSKMAAHHHHGDGMPVCGCGGEDGSRAAERTTGE